MQRILILVAVSLMSISLLAQSGTLNGNVTDLASGEEVPMANISVKGSEQGTSANLMGVYSITLEAGSYTIICSSLGFDDQEKEVTITADESTSLNFQIAEAGVVINNGANVEAKAITNTSNAIDRMKFKDGAVMDGVSAETAKRLGASNVASMTSKAAGVSVEGGKYIYVRGLSDRYSLTTLNGGEIPGLDPNRNSVQLDLFPATLVQNVTIRKSFTPNLPGNFTGGLVDIQTKDFPDSLQYNVSFSLGYNTNATFNSSFLSQQGSSTDVLGFDNGSRALPEAVSSNEVQSVMTGNTSVLQNQTRSFSKSWAPETAVALPNHKFGFSFGNQKTLQNGKLLGFNIATTYAHNYSFYTNGQTGRYKLTGKIEDTDILNEESLYKDSRGDESVIWGALANLSYRYKKGNTIGLTLIRNQNGISSARSQQGRVPSIDSDFLSQQYSVRYLERSLNTAQFKGEHILHESSGFRLNWIASAAYAAQDTPELTILEYLIKDPANGSGFDLYDADINVPSKFYRNMNEWNFDTKLNVIVPIKLEGDKESNLQFGVSNVNKNRNFQERLYEFYSNGVAFNGNVNQFFSDQNMNTSAEDFVYVEDRTDTKNSYDATQNVLSGYAMTDYRISPLWRVIAGARIESARIESTSQKFYEETTAEAQAKYRGELNNVDVLPSLNLTRNIGESTNLRFAYSRTLARPSFREISAFASFDFENQLVQLGNPDLDRTLIDNIDVRYEFYPNIGELFSVSAFYKRFHNPIELVVNPEAANIELTWENQDIATLYGVEFEFKKDLSFIDALEHWKFSTNITLVESKTQIDEDELIQIHETNPLHETTRRMFGQSPYIINAVLSHVNPENGWSSAISYNVSGEKLVLVVNGGTPNVMQQPVHNLGLSVSKAFSNNLKLTLRGANLLDAENARTYNYKGTDYVFQSYRTGRTISASISYTF